MPGDQRGAFLPYTMPHHPKTPRTKSHKISLETALDNRATYVPQIQLCVNSPSASAPAPRSIAAPRVSEQAMRCEQGMPGARFSRTRCPTIPKRHEQNPAKMPRNRARQTRNSCTTYTTMRHSRSASALVPRSIAAPRVSAPFTRDIDSRICSPMQTCADN